MNNISLWKQKLRENFTSWEKLADFLQLSDSHRSEILQRPNFPLNLPMRLAEKIKKATFDDPILKQFLPIKAEFTEQEGFVKDPTGDSLTRRSAKLLHKYEGRVLLIPTSACAMHCRYCFRKNFDYEVTIKGFDNEVAMIRKDATIKEVILSGGDHLSLSNEQLKSLLRELSEIPHIKRLRFHTRFPIGIPERFDEELLQILRSIPQHIWMVIHVNHARELDDDILIALKKLPECGVSLLSQSVLLRGVNDSADELFNLFELLIDNGIMPYYIHQLDRVVGAAHFEVSEAEGLKLLDEVAKKLSGFGIPKYVREVSGEPYKVTVS